MYTIDLFLAPLSSALIGNKAASLIELHRAGFLVPRGVCVTVDAYRRWKADGAITETTRAQLCAAFRTLKPPVAVRSSSPTEDLSDASFAGQYMTVLGVSSEEKLIRAVENCWRSASSDASTAYQRARGTATSVDMALLIQELVPAESAGVMFTMNPVTDRVDQIVVNANFGLGESVVSGNAEPDTFILAKGSHAIVERRLGTKRVVTQRQSDGVEEVPLEGRYRESFSLSDGQLRQLAKAAESIEAHYDCPMDVEWAFVGDTLHMLQARSVTTGLAPYLSDQLDQWARERNLDADPDQTWIRGSVLSGLRLSPLYYSEMSAFFADMFVKIAKLHGAPPIRRKIFKYYSGFAYTDAEFSSTADPPGAIRSEGPLSSAWRSNLKIALRHPLSLAFWRNIDYYNRRWRREWRPEIEARLPHFANASPTAIRDYIEFLEVQRRERSVVAGLAVGYAPNFVGLVAYLLERWLPGTSSNVLGILTSGLPESLTHDENVALWDLSQSANRLPAVREAIMTGNFDRLAEMPEAMAFLLEVDAFRRAHAHRGCSDRDIYQPRWGDDPALLLNQVKLMLTLCANADPRAAHARTAARREQQERDLLCQFRGPLGIVRRMVFMKVLRATQRYVMHRDNQRHTFEPYFLELRRSYSALGDKLVEHGILRQREYVFFLGKAEIYRHIDGELSDKKLSQRARSRYEWWDRVTRSDPPEYLRGNRPFDSRVASTAGNAGLQGAAGAPGVATGPVRIIGSLQELNRIRAGDIIVTYAIDPAWTPVFGIIGGVIAVEGGMLSHAAVLGREYGLPVVLGVRAAPSLLNAGDVVQIAGTTGTVAIVAAANNVSAVDSNL